MKFKFKRIKMQEMKTNKEKRYYRLKITKSVVAPKVENCRMTDPAKSLEFARDVMVSIGKDNNEAVSQD